MEAVAGTFHGVRSSGPKLAKAGHTEESPPTMLRFPLRSRRPGLGFAAVFLALAGLATAQDLARWPAPKDGWWRELEAGEQATYEMVQGPRAGRRVMRVERVEGSRVTVSFQQQQGDETPAVQTTTIDLADPTDAGDLELPEGATLKKVGSEDVKVGDRALRCDRYEVALDGPTGHIAMTTWHSAQLPPVFMGGVVKLESTASGIKASITLVDYQGRLLGQ